ncbi:hypothetical protein BLA50215_05181 [Burkholderia lata]|uniref:hypothetical protein n=1 Tax=Burkholderia lata (strain ATCC 17760 / DSM 23089 / LMG 22485 / NCIMB 9086 / R18194 / 383) TaxID=482957 RepID=UPI0014542015|nr:hypothetical protein [Burkholderia lata]VWD38233.1 hypothetical protein BLA50215_05181 [Burkholderia lata]
MPDMTLESWKGHAIHIRTIPVRQIVARVSVPDSYIAFVRIERSGEVTFQRSLDERGAARSSTR